MTQVARQGEQVFTTSADNKAKQSKA